MSDRSIAQAAALQFCGAVPPDDIREYDGQTCVLHGTDHETHRAMGGLRWPAETSVEEPVGGVAQGLADNGHTRYWAQLPSGGAGPFRSTRERAQRDLDALRAVAS